jgi:hypothetical protein
LRICERDDSIPALFFLFELDVKKVVRKLALATVFLFAAGVASATGTGKETCGWVDVKYTWGAFSVWIPEWECTRIISKTPSVIAAPEMDPTSAIAALTLMLGSLAVLRGRRVKSPKA